VVWSELVALAARAPDVRAQLLPIWRDRWLPMARGELRAARPNATRRQIDEVAYGLVCLVEGHWSLHVQGVDPLVSRRQGRASARLLLASLDASTVQPS
jgi:hypothetical protein